MYISEGSVSHQCGNKLYQTCQDWGMFQTHVVISLTKLVGVTGSQMVTTQSSIKWLKCSKCAASVICQHNYLTYLISCPSEVRFRPIYPAPIHSHNQTAHTYHKTGFSGWRMFVLVFLEVVLLGIDVGGAAIAGGPHTYWMIAKLTSFDHSSENFDLILS